MLSRHFVLLSSPISQLSAAVYQHCCLSSVARGHEICPSWVSFLISSPAVYMVPKLPNHLEELQKNPLGSQISYLWAWSRAQGAGLTPASGCCVAVLGKQRVPPWSRCQPEEENLAACWWNKILLHPSGRSGWDPHGSRSAGTKYTAWKDVSGDKSEPSSTRVGTSGSEMPLSAMTKPLVPVSLIYIQSQWLHRKVIAGMLSHMFLLSIFEIGP